jgi:hypothetical protein
MGGGGASIIDFLRGRGGIYATGTSNIQTFYMLSQYFTGQHCNCLNTVNGIRGPEVRDKWPAPAAPSLCSLCS